MANMQKVVTIHLKKSIRLIFELILFTGISLAITILISAIIASLGVDVRGFYQSDSPFENPYKNLLIGYMPLLMAALSAMFITHVFIFKRSSNLFGLLKRDWIQNFGYGSVIAVVILGLGFIILSITGLLTTENVVWNGRLFVGFALLFLVQSAVEELMTRSYLIPTIEMRWGTWTALILSSGIFSAVHGTNINVSTIGLINIFFAGLLMGLLFIRFRSFWAPLGLHACWNFLQGSFFGFEVSGIDVYSYLETKEVGNDILTGGSFGFEGSILASIMLIFACFYIRKNIPASRWQLITNETQERPASD